MTSGRPNIAVLGGGMAGLAAAWRLTDPHHRDRIGSVTVYQRGWRLGGKAASHRGVHDRIEEHGLHIWLGYYDNAFRMIRDCYAELDRPTTDPTSAIQTWRDAFAPAPLIGLEDLHEGDWRTWTAWFPTNDLLPGEPIDESGTGLPPTAAEFLARSLGLMRAFLASLGDGAVAVDLVPAVALAAGREVHRLLDRLTDVLPIADVPRRTVAALNAALQPMVQDRDGSRRLWHLADLVAAQVRGLVADDLLNKGFHSIDHIEYRDWVSAHGASPETCRGALVRGLYDLAFSHRAGDPSDTAFPTGLGLLLSTKTFFDYRGSLFWKMTAGMGDAVIAPLYQALQRRGVRFEFFHRVDDVIASDDGAAVERIHLGRQVRVLARARQVPAPRSASVASAAFPPSRSPTTRRPRRRSLRTTEVVLVHMARRGHCRARARPGLRRGRLRHPGRHGDARHDRSRPQVGAVARHARTLETIGTQGVQLWLRRSEADLGSPRPGSTVTSYVETFDTFSSMSRLLAPRVVAGGRSPRIGGLPLLVDGVRRGRRPGRPDQPARPTEGPRRRARLPARPRRSLPAEQRRRGWLQWDLLCGAPLGSGPDALDAQYLVANVDPSDRYVRPSREPVVPG